MIAIYVLENLINGKLYVGQTIEIEKRLVAHKRARNDKMYIDRAIRKQGWNNFKQYIYYVPEELLDYFEIEMIKRLNSLSPNGYNLETGGNKNKHPSEETRALMRENHADVSGDKHPMKDKHHSEETIAKMSAKKKGKIPSEKTIAKMRASSKRQAPWNKGMKGRYHFIRKNGKKHV